jgi:membrane protein required for colicin V production
MTALDYGVIGIVAISMLLGLWRGVVTEVVALAAWGIGIFAAVDYGKMVGQAIYSGFADPLVQTLAGCATVFFAILLAMALLGMVVRSMVKALGLSLSDRLLGGAFGLLRGLLMVLVLVGLAGMTGIPQQPWWKGAVLAAPLETVMMAARPWLPADLAKRIRFS